MTYQPLGDSGLVVSTVGLGCNAFGKRVDADGVKAIVKAARETGVTLLDTADIYGSRPGESEVMIGKAIKGMRDEFVVATKFGKDMSGTNGQDFGVRGSRSYIRRAVAASLKRLQTDYIDLYQMHAPDPVTPIRETLAALNELVREGKIRYVGCSNFAAWQLVDAAWTAETMGTEGFCSIQNRYSILDRSAEAEVIPACDAFGVGVLPFFPLEYGLLTGKHRRSMAAPAGSRGSAKAAAWLEQADWDRIDALRGYAAARDITMLDVAIAGLAAQPTVASVIAGATSPDQVYDNAGAIRWVPTDDDLAALDDITSG